MTPSEPIQDSTAPTRQIRAQVVALRTALQEVCISNSLVGARVAAQEGLRKERAIVSGEGS